jgi:hypothetical protein
MLAPRTLDVGPALAELCDEDAVFMVAAVVTREGRVSNYEVLRPVAEQAARGDRGARSARTPRGAGVERGERAERVDPMAVVGDTVRQSRFTPAQTPGGAVAVNMVWLLARTTVKAPFAPGDMGALPPHEAPGKTLSARLTRPVARPARS